MTRPCSRSRTTSARRCPPQTTTRAAEQAINGLAYAEAVELFTRALSLLPRGDERRRILAIRRALSYQALFHAVWDTPTARARTPATATPDAQMMTSSGVMSPTIS